MSFKTNRDINIKIEHITKNNLNKLINNKPLVEEFKLLLIEFITNMREFEKEYGFIYNKKIDINEELEFIINSIQDSKELYLCYNEDNELIGYILVDNKYYFDMDPKKVAINEFHISSKFRGMGYGRLFLTKIILQLKERFKYVMISVLYNNNRAYNLYNSLGFKIIDNQFIISYEKLNVLPNSLLVNIDDIIIQLLNKNELSKLVNSKFFKKWITDKEKELKKKYPIMDIKQLIKLYDKPSVLSGIKNNNIFWLLKHKNIPYMLIEISNENKVIKLYNRIHSKFDMSLLKYFFHQILKQLYIGNNNRYNIYYFNVPIQDTLLSNLIKDIGFVPFMKRMYLK